MIYIQFNKSSFLNQFLWCKLREQNQYPNIGSRQSVSAYQSSALKTQSIPTLLYFSNVAQSLHVTNNFLSQPWNSNHFLMYPKIYNSMNKTNVQQAGFSVSRAAQCTQLALSQNIPIFILKSNRLFEVVSMYLGQPWFGLAFPKWLDFFITQTQYQKKNLYTASMKITA